MRIAIAAAALLAAGLAAAPALAAEHVVPLASILRGRRKSVGPSG